MEVENKNPKIFLISGKARNGKDTTALMIKDYYESKGKKVINLQYGSYIKEYAKKISGWNGSENTKPRELLQQLGTDVIRKKIDSLFFVNSIIKDIKVYSYFFDIITISDVRTPEEVEYPKKEFNNIYSIRIKRVNFEDNMTEEQRHHYTEIALDDYNNFDYHLLNDGSLDDLKNKVNNILEEVEHES